ncbi:MAG TPA: SMC family ATPase [Pyrinomonadaceae bacterium]|nr:SMC family ATPase [Pyrinomonadaceae bacterium]
MHVTRVELDNIKAYERAEYGFERGTTAIVGPNGAGKTTILEAIAWALFDTLEYSKDDFLRRGAKKGSVRVTFESDLDERQYVVYRDTGQGYYVFDLALGVRLAEKRTDVRAFLNLHLGIEAGTDLKALFRSAIGVPQGLLTADFREPLGERKAKFDRLLKVEEYREGAKRLGETVKLINDRLLEIHKRISNAEGQLTHYDERITEHRTAVERMSELDASLVDSQADVEARARIVEELDAAERRVNETRSLSDRLDVEREAAENRLRDVRAELAAAERAAERQRATEADHGAHLEASERLRALESERAERDRLRGEASGAARLVVAAEADVRRLADALERASRARVSLVELEAEIGAQEELERERERLRDLLARARAGRERLQRLDAELEELRRAHAQTKERVRAAEGAGETQGRVEQLESERTEAETRLSRVENDLTARKVFQKQRREQAQEVERLRRSVVALERETRELELGAKGAERAAELEARERELSQTAAHLRASIERDEKICVEVEGGVCPLLGDRCSSFSDSAEHEKYFKQHLATARAELATVERESAMVVEAVRGARAAATASAQLARERARLTEARELLHASEEKLARIDEELSKLQEATPQLLDELQIKLSGIDAVLKNLREDAKRHSELEPLRARLSEIETEGKRRREERDELAAVANALDALTDEIKETEARLRALNDPRGRAAALRAEAAREDAFKVEAQDARDALAALVEQKSALEAELERFRELDERWSQAVAERDRTAGAYREYLASSQLAATLPARETEAANASERAERAGADAQAARDEHARAVAGYDRERHNQERGRLSLARERAATLTAQLEAARERESSLAAEIARLDEVRDALRDEFRAKEHLEEMHEATDFIRDTLKAAGPLVTESYLFNISIEANQLYREITGEGGRALRWTKDYEIMLEEGGYERSFMNLSGGEQMVAALAVRLALLKQLSNIRLAFFDEPTVNMDEERRQNLARQIGQVRHFDQLFVISHDDTFEETVDHVLTVTRETAEVA